MLPEQLAHPPSANWSIRWHPDKNPAPLREFTTEVTKIINQVLEQVEEEEQQQKQQQTGADVDAAGGGKGAAAGQGWNRPQPQRQSSHQRSCQDRD